MSGLISIQYTKKTNLILNVLYIFLFGVYSILIFQSCSNISSSSPAASASFSSSSSSLNPNVSEQVTVTNIVQANINSTFAGFSYEKSILSKNLFSDSNTALINLFKLLGPGILRIGGNSVNCEGSLSTWNAGGSGLVSGQVSRSDVDRLAAFLNATGWKVIYGLYGAGGGTYTSGIYTEPSQAAGIASSTDEAVYAAKILGSTLIGFEIGNEPDLYHGNLLEPSTFSFTDFCSLWNSYYTSINSALVTTGISPVNFSGPSSAGNYSTYTVPFASAFKNSINLLTQHYYVANGLSTPPPTIDKLIQSIQPGNSSYNSLITELTAVKNAAVSYTGGKYRIAETNSFYNGGAPGISNNFGSALWSLEFCFTLAQNGASGVNFHGGGSSTGYTPIANDSKGIILEARAEYYGILLFSQVANGNMITTKNTGTATGFSSYAVNENDGSTAIILVNNSRTEITAATVYLPAVFTSASSMFLTASSIDATSGMTLGGSPVNSDGSWIPQTINNVKLNGASFDIIVPSGTAVWIKLIN
jgi:hypothetical protein